MPKADPRATPEGDEAHAVNLKAQKEIRNSARSLGWDLVQEQVHGKRKDSGSRSMVLYCHVGPLILYVRFQIDMAVGSTEGSVRVSSDPYHDRPGLTMWGHILGVPDSPDRSIDLTQEDAQAIIFLFAEEFQGDLYKATFKGVGISPVTLENAINWFERRQKGWVKYVEAILLPYKNATWDVVLKVEGKEIHRITYQTRQDALLYSMTPLVTTGVEKTPTS